MKALTLNEVIKIMEKRYKSEPWDDVAKEAIYYLHAFINQQDFYKQSIAHVIEVIDHYEKMVADYLSVNNPALTWDYLKLMEGKPLWVEEYYYNGQKKSAGWWLVDTQDDEQIVLRDQAGNPWYAYFISMGTDWKAYRKERDHE